MNEFIIDVILLLFLTCSIVWCAVVHRRLKKIGFERNEVTSFIQSVDAVVERAEAAMARLKTTAEDVALRTSTEEDEARHRLDELNKLISAANRVAQRLETSMNTAYRRLAEERSRATAPVEEALPKPVLPVQPAHPIEAQPREPRPMPGLALRRRPISSDLVAPADEPAELGSVAREMPLGTAENESAPSILSTLSRPRHRSTVNSILDRLNRHAPRERMLEPVEAV